VGIRRSGWDLRRSGRRRNLGCLPRGPWSPHPLPESVQRDLYRVFARGGIVTSSAVALSTGDDRQDNGTAHDVTQSEAYNWRMLRELVDVTLLWHEDGPLGLTPDLRGHDRPPVAAWATPSAAAPCFTSCCTWATPPSPLRTARTRTRVRRETARNLARDLHRLGEALLRHRTVDGRLRDSQGDRMTPDRLAMSASCWATSRPRRPRRTPTSPTSPTRVASRCSQR
jgi:hypothetical protein